LLSIPNSGKGYALAYGLRETSGQIIFRTDADSIIDEHALQPMMDHFQDPEVGAVCGWVFPLREGKGPWSGAQCIMCVNAMYTKMAEVEFDSLIVMPGPTAAFRKEALDKAGGWVDNIFGEDGEITNRVARYGYKGVYEPKSIVYSEFPETLMGLLQQRARWGVAFYHSRGRNLRLSTELWTPRSIVFLWGLIMHGAVFGRNLIFPFLAALAATVTLGLAPQDIAYLFMPSTEILWFFLAKIASVHAIIVALHLILFAYALKKVNRLSALLWYPIWRLMHLTITMMVRPHVINVALLWSAKWKEYSTESFKSLRKVVKSIDPAYPDGEDLVPKPAVEKNLPMGN
jgi:cellulose synthase/poly-beta-1,6-N-acetylglucosamine synthase-like glycosyltransferase